MAGLTEEVLAFIEDRELFSPGDGVVVGVSGGPDSVCLLHLLSGLRSRLELRLWAGYLDHGLRSGEGEADAAYVAQLCQILKVPFNCHRADTAGYRRQHHLSWEEAARQLRYDFLASVAAQAGTKKVAIGHTADDQAETVLLHLLRGSGLRGLRGMTPKSHRGELEVIRPLLNVSRKQTEAYCQEWVLNPRLDSTNLSLDFTRNRLRREIMPQLLNLNPRLRQALLRTSHSLAQDLSLVERELLQVWDKVVTAEVGGVSLDKNRLTSFHPSIKRHLLLRLGEAQGVSLEGVHIEAMLASLTQPGTALSLPGGLNWIVEYRRAWLGKGLPPSPLPHLSGEHIILAPGVSHLPGWKVTANIVSAPASAVNKPLTAFLDADIAGTRLLVRGWQDGDRFQPLGMAQEKKLQDFWVDARVPRPWRRHVPLVVSPQHILWVVGYRIDDRVKLSPRTRSVLSVEFTPTSLSLLPAWLTGAKGGV